MPEGNRAQFAVSETGEVIESETRRRYLARLFWVGPSDKAHGLDMTDEMLALAGDLILSAAMLEYLPKEQLPIALAALRARLAPDGTLLVSIARAKFADAGSDRVAVAVGNLSSEAANEPFEGAGCRPMRLNRFAMLVESPRGGMAWAQIKIRNALRSQPRALRGGRSLPVRWPPLAV